MDATSTHPNDTVGGTSEQAYPINATGQVVGHSSSPEQAVIWNGTTPTVLDTLGGTSMDRAFTTA